MANKALDQVDIAEMFALPSAETLRQAAMNATAKINRRFSQVDGRNASSIDPAVLHEAVAGAQQAVFSIAASTVSVLAHRAAAHACAKVVSGSSGIEDKLQVSSRAVEEGVAAAQQAGRRFIKEAAVTAATVETAKAVEKLVGGNMAVHAVDAAVDILSARLAKNSTKMVVARLSRAAAKEAVKQGLADPEHEELAASAAFEAASKPAHTAALQAARRVLAEPALLKRGIAVARGAAINSQFGDDPRQAAQIMVLKFFKTRAGFEAERAAEGAALEAASPLVSDAAKKGAKLQLIQQVAKAAVDGLEQSELQAAAAEALTHVAAAEASAQVVQMAEQVGITSSEELHKMKQTAAQTVARIADLSSLQAEAVKAGTVAARQAARQAAEAALQAANTEPELKAAEVAARVQASAVAQKAAVIAAGSAAGALGKSRLLDPQVAAAVTSQLHANTRADIAGRMTTKAATVLAESLSEESRHWARHGVIPAAVGEAMHDATERIEKSKLATDVQLAMAVAPASRALQDSVESAVGTASKAAVRALVTSEVAAMVHAAVDHALAISTGDDQQEVAQEAATQTVESACLEDGTDAANRAAAESAKAAAHGMAEKVLMATIEHQQEAKRVRAMKQQR
eukprot:TRINITY_DN7995_c0_g1_i1.p1 TRINITY_DN7995_c0_g1~~TRINITY_DN7995_c0_g1_i1.p1  ORF type:complete len:629 (+),score=221.39 TRINITY_DN7995_c0_g1_i1:109-1995(+)